MSIHYIIISCGVHFSEENVGKYLCHSKNSHFFGVPKSHLFNFLFDFQKKKNCVICCINSF